MTTEHEHLVPGPYPCGNCQAVCNLRLSVPPGEVMALPDALLVPGVAEATLKCPCCGWTQEGTFTGMQVCEHGALIGGEYQAGRLTAKREELTPLQWAQRGRLVGAATTVWCATLSIYDVFRGLRWAAAVMIVLSAVSGFVFGSVWIKHRQLKARADAEGQP